MSAGGVRDAVREHVLRLAETDERVIAAAVVGSLAHGPGDRWSDLDLTFGVARADDLSDVMEEWQGELDRAFGATHLLDVESGELVYRVFLLPGGMQVDLSFAPGGARRAGPAFAPLFGPTESRLPARRAVADVFAWAVLYARHAHVALARGRVWHAEYCVGEVRDHALTLACLRRRLPASYGKGFDDLPNDLHTSAADAIPRSLEREELRRALAAAVGVLLAEAERGKVHPAHDRIEQSLRELARSPN